LLESVRMTVASLWLWFVAIVRVLLLVVEAVRLLIVRLNEVSPKMRWVIHVVD
jgi:hypothetical protein